MFWSFIRSAVYLIPGVKSGGNVGSSGRVSNGFDGNFLIILYSSGRVAATGCVRLSTGLYFLGFLVFFCSILERESECIELLCANV